MLDAPVVETPWCVRAVPLRAPRAKALALTRAQPRASLASRRSRSEVDTVAPLNPQQRFERSQSSRSSARAAIPAEDLRNRVVLTREERARICIFGRRDDAAEERGGDDERLERVRLAQDRIREQRRRAERLDADARPPGDAKLASQGSFLALLRGRGGGGVLTGGGARTIG